ncbi:MAG: DUF4421 family protein [Bacteroidota bacterium]
MKNLSLLFFIYLNIFSFAQTDTTCIQKLPNDRVFGVHTTLRQFQLSFSTANNEPIFFENYNLGMGFRAKYNKLAFSFSIPIANFNDAALEKSKAYALGFGLYPKSLFIQGDFRFIQGLNDLNEGVFRADMSAAYANLYAVHLFNSDHLSLRSAFNMVDRQKRSAGSWILSSILEYQYFDTDSLSLRTSNGQLNITRYNSYKFGLGSGYAQSIVKGNWSLTGLLSGGLEFRRLYYQASEASNFRDKFLISPRLRFFASIIHNGDYFFYGITSNYLPRLDTAEELNTRIIDWTIRATVGWRL